MEIQEHGLSWIRKEIYENVGQVLSYVKLRLSDHVPVGTLQLKQSMAISKKLVGQAIRDLRVASWPVSVTELREKGLAMALEHELATFSRLYNREAQCRVSDNARRFDPDREIIAFRILQQLLDRVEALTPARPVEVRLDYRKTDLCIILLHGSAAVPPETGWKPADDWPDYQLFQQRAALIRAGLEWFGDPQEDLAFRLLIPLSV